MSFSRCKVKADDAWKFICIEPPNVSDEIQSGSVLDGTSRGITSLHQMQQLLLLQPNNNDVVYLQDLWTPGFEALLYQWALLEDRPAVYAMCHAQSVDEYDFTYKMRSWMRGIELSYMNALDGLFVASTIHRDQLKAAGATCPIHVVGLPFDSVAVQQRIQPYSGEKQQLVVYTSRLNNEKNPHFMLDVAEGFLANTVNWGWKMTTSAATFRSEVPGVLERHQPESYFYAAKLL
jgi:glycosyltransferase involved in cell wall biosynthesis